VPHSVHAVLSDDAAESIASCVVMSKLYYCNLLFYSTPKIPLTSYSAFRMCWPMW